MAPAVGEVPFCDPVLLRWGVERGLVMAVAAAAALGRRVVGLLRLLVLGELLFGEAFEFVEHGVGWYQDGRDDGLSCSFWFPDLY